MAVVSVNEAFVRRRSWRDRDGRHHIRVFVVRTDAGSDGPAVALAATGVPAFNAAHPSGDGTIVQAITSDPVNRDDRTFEVVVQYDAPTNSGQQQAENPLDRPAEINCEGATTIEEYFFDESDPARPVVNSAGFPFDDVPARESAELVIVVTVNVATRDLAADAALANTVNNNNFTIDGTVFLAGTLKLDPIRSRRVVEGEYVYYQKAYRFKARVAGWMQRFQDVTYYIMEEGKPREITVDDQDGQRSAIRKPWPLDGEGNLKENFDDEPGQLEFQPYKQVNWSVSF
jgi:hypothetical protein